jgi:MFS family permease
MSIPATNVPAKVTPVIAFQNPNFRFFVLTRFLTTTASEMQALAVAWQVYNLTHRPMDLGYVGLAQFLPGILLFLLAGHVADRFSRIKILVTCYGLFSLCSLALLTFSLRGITSVYSIYLVLLINGVVRAFNWPAGMAFLPRLVPPEHFPNAVTWNSSIFQGATLCGPILGGVIYAATGNATAVYLLSAAAYLLGLLSTLQIRVPASLVRGAGFSTNTVMEGFHYIWDNKLILGSISLDLFAVFLGGAVALLPVYARDILQVNAVGLGILRSAPGAGAILMAVFLAYRPLRRRAGEIMLFSVAGFGVATILFGVSRSLWVSVLALSLVGATDMVSVLVRHIVTQLAVPDNMRGRISAVNMIFIGTSNEVGQFESGITAQWMGTVPAVIAGGVGTILIVIAWWHLFPTLRKVDTLVPE